MFQMKLLFFFSEIVIGSVFCVSNGSVGEPDITLKGRQSSGISFFPIDANTRQSIDSNSVDYNGPTRQENPTFKFIENSENLYQNQNNYINQKQQYPILPQQQIGVSEFFNSGEYIKPNRVTKYKPEHQYTTRPVITSYGPNNAEQSPNYYNYYGQYNNNGYQQQYQQPQQPYRRRRPSASNPYFQNYYQQSYAPSQLPGAHPYQQNYASNFNSYQSDGNPLSNFLTTLGLGTAGIFGGETTPHQYQPLTQPNGQQSEFIRAIDGITKHDDYQCIPKIICKMVGSQRQQNSISPLLSALISAVPSVSSGLTYGRAALLGYTSGERGCDSSYPKCPKNEDDLLYYLNNHRGGFFRFFNGGTSFGDDNSNQQYDTNQQNNQIYQQQNQQQSSSSVGNLLLLQGLADSINQSGGINLSNLGANAGLLNNLVNLLNYQQSSASSPSSSTAPYKQSASVYQNTDTTGSYNLNDMFANLLTGLVGNRFTSKKLSKRSLESSTDSQEVSTDDKEMPQISDEAEVVEEPNDDSLCINSDSHLSCHNEMEGRIINQKSNVVSNGPNILFPNQNQFEESNQVKFVDFDISQNGVPILKLAETLKFPLDTDHIRNGKNINFQNTENSQSGPSGINFPEKSPSGEIKTEGVYNNLNEDVTKLKMVFPDRTGTGNLRFDNKEFERLSYDIGYRLGKILSGVKKTNPSDGNNPIDTFSFGQSDNKYQSNYNNRYENSNNNNNYYNYQTTRRPFIIANPPEDTSQNIYVTNSQGVTEYYIKNGQKFYIK